MLLQKIVFVQITIHHVNHGYHGTKTMKYIGSLNNEFHCFGTMITMVDGNLDQKKHGYHGTFLCWKRGVGVGAAPKSVDEHWGEFK